jgi:hypothetical protein
VPLTSRVTFQVPGPRGTSTSLPNARYRAIITLTESVAKTPAVATQRIVRDMPLSKKSEIRIPKFETNPKPRIQNRQRTGQPFGFSYLVI